MKESVKHAGIIGSVPGAAGREVPSKSGWISLIDDTARRLTRREPRTTAVDTDTRTGERNARDPGTSRSALDAGLTGGMTFLFDGSGKGRRR
ncbi:hypothetical protein GBA63_06470 [Rubrobacter tropicus]|uniref:Uncharacterized protein n=1 Tax=Rubrobacter tropicus TaxID=2653851 RepID=A0A6G8Q7B1_9ACTN|nr:hypothetical protein [Rubrobacter tropicus]QIN82333.1 hypothetical protein GBA63_06470 [Rubrobacter tropicus]